MELSKATEFIYVPVTLDTVIYISRDIRKILDNCMDAQYLCGLYGVINTVQGDILFEIEEAYNHEPVITRKFMHKDSFLKFNCDRKVIHI